MKVSSRHIVIATSAIIIVVSLTWIINAALLSKRQDWNMEKAARHIAVIEPAIRADARFSHVDLTAGTVDNGCLWLHGFVDSERAKADLFKIVTNSHPPVFTRYEVIVIPD